jgi:tRNA U34 5-methylaminomethyl-2-thiouridine-forming methyltransferase MnmC
MAPQLHQSKDGSSTLYSEKFDQFYHNPNGAASESLHVFFETPGLFDFLKKEESVTILEVGFGTGLNLLLLIDFLKANEIGIPVNYFTIEAFPIDAPTSKTLNFEGHLTHKTLTDILPEVFGNLQPGMNNFRPDSSVNVELNVFAGSFSDFNPDEIQADFIFHDPFSPEVNEELWTADTFMKLKSFSSPNAVLATYCAASKARGAMCSAGWFVARTQGALGKREMTVASLNEENLSEFKRVNEERFAKRYRENDFG